MDNQLNIVSVKIKEFKKPFFLFFIFLLISLVLIVAGLYYYTVQQTKIKAQIYSKLDYIARVKEDQIANWRRERINDANDFQTNQSLINDVNSYFVDSSNIIIKSRILNWLKYLSKNADYTDVYLLNKDLNVKIQANTEMYFDSATRELLKLSLRTKETGFTDLHKSETSNKIHMDIIIPLLYPDNPAGNIIGVVLLIIDPQKEFYPMIQTWPTDSKSGETVLVYAEKDSIVYLNKLRFIENSHLNFKIPNVDMNIPSVEAAHGYVGIFEGKDYRGVPVLSDIRHIPGTNWWMITKEDLSEILTPLHQSSLIIASFVFIFLLTSGFTLLFVWKSQQSKFYKERYRFEVEKQKQQYLFHLIMESLPVGIWIFDKDANITDRNIKALEIWGGDIYSWVDENNQRPAWYYETGKKIESEEWASTRAINKGESTINEIIEIECLDGSHKIIFNSAVPVYEKGDEIIGAVVVNQDITELKRAEETIKDSLKEKEVLLRELYHRTKNNMQVISSLLGLKAAGIEDDRLSKVLEEMNIRIQTISLVHQKLYQSQNLSRIDLKEYITDLVELISKSYYPEPGRITVITELESINVLIDTAIPCGLIINELVSNAFKYAFPGNRRGIIKILLKRVVGEIIELGISDDGVGIPDGFNLLESNTLGYKLFKSIAEDQLMGTVKIETKKGLSFTIHFKDVLYKERV
jgi:PAS domain S-box-containing protein